MNEKNQKVMRKLAREEPSIMIVLIGVFICAVSLLAISLYLINTKVFSEDIYTLSLFIGIVFLLSYLSVELLDMIFIGFGVKL